MRERNIWLDGIMGLVTGDALGNPVQFMGREEIRERGAVTGMEGGGVYHTPVGTWTDDSSMALATLDSIRETGSVVPEDIMLNFLRWNYDGAYTPLGYAFDQGATCLGAIDRFRHYREWRTCGRTGEYANGNGALMRILPVCLYYAEHESSGADAFRLDEAVEMIHQVTALTHNHLRAKIGSGLYYFMVRAILFGEGGLRERLGKGLADGHAYYAGDSLNLTELSRYGRLFDPDRFSKVPEAAVRSSGYVVDTLEAAVWALLQADSYEESLLIAVNLGSDTDTVGAVAGGLAGLFYGYGQIPEAWLSVLQKREWVEGLCR